MAQWINLSLVVALAPLAGAVIAGLLGRAIGRRGAQPLQIARRKKGCSMVWNRFMRVAGLDPGQVRYSCRTVRNGFCPGPWVGNGNFIFPLRLASKMYRRRV